MSHGRQRRRTRSPLAAIAPYTLDPAPMLGPDIPVDPGRAVLLIQDMRGPLVAPFDLSSPSAQIVAAGRHIAALALAARNAGVPVIHVDVPGDGAERGSALLAGLWRSDGSGAGPAGTGTHGTRSAGSRSIGTGTAGTAATWPESAPAAGDIVLTRSQHSAFTGTDLRHRLRTLGRDQVLVTGVYAHIGALATTTAAQMDRMQAFVVPDATADLGESEHREALDQAVIFGACVRPTEYILRDLKTDPSVDGVADTSPR